MKNESSLKMSMESALSIALDASEDMAGLLLLLQLRRNEPSKVMPRIRALLGEINQRVHEYNAYRNALETE